MYVQPAVLASFDAAQLLGPAYGGHHWAWGKTKQGDTDHDGDDVGNGSSHDS